MPARKLWEPKHGTEFLSTEATSAASLGVSGNAVIELRLCGLWVLTWGANTVQSFGCSAGITWAENQLHAFTMSAQSGYVAGIRLRDTSVFLYPVAAPGYPTRFTWCVTRLEKR